MSRRALQEIPSTLRLRANDTVANWHTLYSTSLTPSPAEEVIQQRRRSFLISQYEDVDHFDEIRTPCKEQGLSILSRKRLLLTPPDSGSKAKRQKLQGKVSSLNSKLNPKTPLKTELTAYSTEQLIEIIDLLVSEHPSLEQEIRDALGQPDLQHMEQNLLFLRRNIYRALPRYRWETSRDAFSFKSVKVHLNTFKKACADNGRRLLLATCWESAINYAIMASKYAHQLPDWDNPSHNTLKITCQRTLAAQCMVALRRALLTTNALKDIRMRLESTLTMNPELQPCVSHIDKLLE